MRGGALLRRVVHVDGTNLYKPVSVANAGVEAPVSVGLGIGDVVLESKWFGLKKSVDDIERKVTIVLARHDEAKGKQVVNLLEEKNLLPHLSPHSGDVLGSALNRHQGNSISSKRGFDDRFRRGG